MTKRLPAIFTVSILCLAVACAAQFTRIGVTHAATPFEALTIPLYRYQAKNGSGVYAAYPAYRKLFENASNVWDEFGVVGHVYPSKQAGTMPLLALRKPASVGIASLYFYTTDIDEALAKQNSGWEAVQNYKGVVGYVATTAQAGTIAVYRYRQPTAAGGYIYAFGESENNTLKQNTGLKFEKLAFYVWAKPVEPKPSQSNFPSGQTSSNFPSAATVDLLMRPALYFNGTNSTKVNTASKYATPQKPMTLKKSEAIECAGGYCAFNLGLFVQRSNGDGPLASYALIGGPGLGSVGNSFAFEAGSRSRDFVLPIRLKMGENKVRVTIDPFAETAETNEANNSFEVTIIVQP